MRRYATIVTTIILIFCISCYAYAEDLTNLQEQSNEITQALNEVNNRLQTVKENISQNMLQLQELDNQVAKTEDEIYTIDSQIQNLNIQIKENEEKLLITQNEYDNIQETLNERLIQMYETPKLQFLQVLLEARSVSDFLSSYYAMKELAEYDEKLLEDVKIQKDQIEETKQLLENDKLQIVENKLAQRKKSQVLTNTKTMREYYLNQLTAEEQALQLQIDEYNAQVATIEAEIKLLSFNSISEDYIGGPMIWPIPGYTTITSQYGMRVHPITGAYKLHTGTDVSAPIGASFVAIANGIVVKATYNTAYGNMVIIDHGGGVQTLYAHGSEIVAQLGQVVSAGDEILKVGSTGYSTGPHAHFEIRINGQTIDPIQLLVTSDSNID